MRQKIGAITVSGKQFTAINSRFENCSSKNGGAIQFYSVATGGTVSKRTFAVCAIAVLAVYKKKKEKAGK